MSMCLTMMILCEYERRKKVAGKEKVKGSPKRKKFAGEKAGGAGKEERKLSGQKNFAGQKELVTNLRSVIVVVERKKDYCKLTLEGKGYKQAS
ncbi:hypothetical protein HanIR_Chr17g0878731 [Helianthus annuus]|nr:hypothetical protein HanIR_Chr17g0878731 [Helianthus annuus]